MENNQKLAELLFPDVRETVEDLEQRFPPRSLPEGAKVTRFAPCPTGFLHIGGLFAAFIAERSAHANGGVFYLRIEDTDKKKTSFGKIHIVGQCLTKIAGSDNNQIMSMIQTKYLSNFGI